MSIAASATQQPGLRYPGEISFPRGRFYLENGIEVPSVSASQMREIERIAWEESGPDALYMTERTGVSAALLTMDLLGTAAQRSRVLVLAGRGAGAQAGICAARHLAELRIPVQLCFSNPPFAGQLLSYQHRLYETIHGQEVDLWNLQEQKPDFIIDALLDYRFGDSVPNGNIPGMIRWANSSGAPMLSMDIPSGVNPTTGAIRADFIRPKWTLTPGLPKSGLLPEVAGQLYLADVGLRAESIARLGVHYSNPFENKLWIPIACEAYGPGLDW